MKKILIVALAVAVTAAAVEWGALRRARRENTRLRQNQETLAGEAETYRTRAGESAAGVDALTLKVGELERLRKSDAEQIRALKVRLRRAESVARSAVVSRTEFSAPLERTDSAEAADGQTKAAWPLERTWKSVLPMADTCLRYGELSAEAGRVRSGADVDLRGGRFRWSDRWTTVTGSVTADSVHCSVSSVDTLVQVVHRVPRRFLFFRFGTKAIRQEIVSKNPHNRVVYTEYIELERRRRRR